MTHTRVPNSTGGRGLGRPRAYVSSVTSGDTTPLESVDSVPRVVAKSYQQSHLTRCLYFLVRLIYLLLSTSCLPLLFPESNSHLVKPDQTTLTLLNILKEKSYYCLFKMPLSLSQRANKENVPVVDAECPQKLPGSSNNPICE
jgi:hypothetical protein